MQALDQVDDGVAVVGSGEVRVPGVGRVVAGFAVRPDAPAGAAASLRVRGGNVGFTADVLTGLSGEGGHVTWTGTGTWRGVPGHRFAATAVRGQDGPLFGLVVLGPDGRAVFSTRGPQPVTGGAVSFSPR